MWSLVKYCCCDNSLRLWPKIATGIMKGLALLMQGELSVENDDVKGRVLVSSPLETDKLQYLETTKAAAYLSPAQS